MALQGSGQIKLSEIASEYGGSVPHALSEYHGKGNAPGSGEIELATDFYGTSNNWTHTISSNQQQMNLASYASGQGWDGSSAAVITVNSGVHITSGDPGTPALSTGSFPGGLHIINNGNIHGDGGNGGHTFGGFGPGYPGGSAGHGISVTNSTSMQLTNTGTIAGGGGGSGGHSSCHGGCQWFGCGGSGGRTGYGHTTPGGCNSHTGCCGSTGSYTSGTFWGNNGGGGSPSTWPGGAGGAGGDAVVGSYTLVSNSGNMYG